MKKNGSNPNSKGIPLDEQALLKGPIADILAYIKGHDFSESMEPTFVLTVGETCLYDYINRYGLKAQTLKELIDMSVDANEELKQKLLVVLRVFVKLRHFVPEPDYMLTHAADWMLDAYLISNKVQLVGDDQVLQLLKRSNTELFASYVRSEWYISNGVILEVVRLKKYEAFQAIMFRLFRHFKEKTDPYQQENADDEVLPEEVQAAVLDSGDEILISTMLRNTPLFKTIFNRMLKEEYPVELFGLHARTVYGIRGYRFERGLEDKFFELLSSTDLDDFLLKYRASDDVSLVKYGSYKGVLKFLQENWPSDDAQIELVLRGHVDLIMGFIAKCNPGKGMCWQAEVEMAKLCSENVIKAYIKVHTMSGEALDILRQRYPSAMEFYNNQHSF